MPQLEGAHAHAAASLNADSAHVPTAAVASEAGHVTVELGPVVLEIVTETRHARAQLTLTDGRWMVRIVDA